MQPPARARKLLTIAAVSCPLGIVSNARAQFWTGPADGPWSDPTNWDTFVVPNSPTADVVIDSSGAQNSIVRLDLFALVRSLQVNSGDELNFNQNTSLVVFGNGTNADLHNFGKVVVGPRSELLSGATGTLKIDGGGQVIMSGSTARLAGSGRIVNSDNIISGDGTVGGNAAAFTNNATIDASTPTRPMILDPGPAGATAFINNGILTATAGWLFLTGNGGGDFSNINGYLNANGGTIELLSDAAIVGGTFQTVAGGRIRVSTNHAASVNTITNSGLFQVDPGGTLTVGGTITNDGTLELNANNGTAWLNVNGSVTYTGAGAVVLTEAGTGAAGVSSTPNAFIVNNGGHTIRGSGTAVSDQNLTNNGRISADAAGRSLLVAPHFGLQINNGELRSIGGGVLVLSGQFGGGIFGGGGGGIITAGNGSRVDLTNNIYLSGGLLTGAGSFTVNSGTGAKLANLGNDASMVVSGDLLQLDGGITNNGAINVAGITPSRIRPNLSTTTVTLSGIGTVSLGGINAIMEGPGKFINAAAHHIQGGGFLGNDTAVLQNDGIIMAFDPAAMLIVDPGGAPMLHTGTFIARNGGTLRLSGNGGQGFSGAGAIRVDTGAQMQFSNQASANFTGTTVADGTLSVIGSSSVSLAGISGTGTVQLFTPAHLSAAHVRVDSININAGSLAIRAGGGTMGTSSAKTISIAGAMDISNHAFLLDYTGPSTIAQVAGYIQSGHAGGSWTGLGLRSSTAAADALHQTGLGYAESTEIVVPLAGFFAGLPFDSTTVVVDYTLYGDATLDHRVNLDDFTALAANFGQSARWRQGDFNYDGVANLDDFTALAANFGLNLPSAPSTRTVPEPTAAMLSLLCSTLLARRTRAMRTIP